MDSDNQSNHFNGYLTRSKAKQFTQSNKSSNSDSVNKTKAKKVRKILKIDDHTDELLINRKKRSKQHRSKKDFVNTVNEEIVLDSIKITPPLQNITLINKDHKKENKNDIIDFSDEAQRLLTAFVLDKALSSFKQDLPEGYDEEYVPLEGLPEEVIYMEDEEKLC